MNTMNNNFCYLPFELYSISLNPSLSADATLYGLSIVAYYISSARRFSNSFPGEFVLVS